jgi:hypothetical protein
MLNATTNVGAATSWQSVAPETNGTSGLSETCALLALMVKSQTASQATSKTDVEFDFKKLAELKQQLAEAIQRAKEASEHHGFFGFLSSVFGSDVAQIAGAVAAIAAVVATGGAAAPLILMAVSVALEEGAKVGAKLGLDPKICMAISLCSAAIGLCSGGGSAQAASTLTTVAKDVKLGANVVKDAALVSGSALGAVAEHYHAAELRYQADATGYRAKDTATNMELDDAIALLQQALSTEQRETTTVSAIVRNNADANTGLSSRV